MEPSRIFAELRTILIAHTGDLDLTDDTDESYSLNTHHVMKNGKPLFFGAVQIRKRYVSFHLMPVYVNPSLLKGLSPALRKRMHGKSCFNFTQVEADLFSELAALTRSGFDDYVSEGYIDR
jgi:hypothetical protein